VAPRQLQFDMAGGQFYEQLLRRQIPKAQKYSQAVSLFLAFGIWARKRCV